VDKSQLKEKGLHVLKEFAVIASYLWLVFSLFQLYKSVILREEHIDVVRRGLTLALINALAPGKVLLVIRALHLGDRFNNRPLVLTAVMKSALFAIFLVVFQVLEETAVGLYHQKSFQQSIADLGGGNLQGILTVGLILFVMLIPFVGLMELQTVLGKEKYAQLFRGPRASEGLPKRVA
jgi:hypothetical protein